VGLEAIRGVATMMVGLSHLLFLDLLTPAYPLPPWLRTIEAGHAGVMIFFVLSGYLISWTNPGPYSPRATRGYVWRRFVRLAPIYYIAIAITAAVVLFTGITDPPRVLVGALLGMQNFNNYFGFRLAPPLVNGPLWSLNYEILYYGLFIVLWKFRPRLFWVFGPALIAGVMGWFTPRLMPLFISSYASGWLFWAMGWWLSKQPVIEDGENSSQPYLTWIMLLVASYEIAGITRIFNVLGWYSKDAGMVAICDLALVPASLLTIAGLARRRLPFRGPLVFLAWAICIVPAIGMVWTGRLWGQPPWVTGCVALLLAIAFLPIRSTKWFRPFAWLGGISYAFYLVHYPLLYFVQFLPLPKATAAGFLLRVPIWIALTVGIAWALERRFQPWIKARLAPPARSTN
jgi:peptidoglycan/LPS O-acetylase OafA/YrhL